jgi:amino-acid N-acetyltransferase
MIRPATIHDVPRIQEIINSHAELGKMLFKSLAQLYETLRDFVVYEIGTSDEHTATADINGSDGELSASGDAIETIDSYQHYGRGQVVGCVALSVLWADLAEVRSLAVDESCRGKGIGTRLVEWSIDEARRLQIRRIMALTYEKAFFEKLGFDMVDKDTLPLKVWSDCVRCPKKDGCDEIAMVKFLSDVPMIVMHQAPPTPRGVSIPVLQEAADD